MSKHKLRLKRQRRRERARAREATTAVQITQPAVVVLNGADILKSLEKRFDELLVPRTPEEALVKILVSKN
jgi:hypothetical protein